MEYDKNVCPVVDVDGVIASGKQFDLEIRLPEDNRNVIYGIIKDCYGDPVCDAVVKLIEIVCECGKEERRPVSHTFTDKEGEFVFGPLCSNKEYSIQIWVDHVKHCKICTNCKHEGKCLKGVKIECKHNCKQDEKYDKKCEDMYEDIYDKKCDDKHNIKCDCKCDCKHDENHNEKCDDKHDEKCNCKQNCKCFRPCLRTEIMPDCCEKKGKF